MQTCLKHAGLTRFSMMSLVDVPMQATKATSCPPNSCSDHQNNNPFPKKMGFEPPKNATNSYKAHGPC